jgi:uncharacterized membrane-anchored protein
VEFLNAAGLLGMLVLIVVSGFRGWWVYGYLYREMKADRDIRANVNERAVIVAHEALTLLSEREDRR